MPIGPEERLLGACVLVVALYVALPMLVYSISKAAGAGWWRGRDAAKKHKGKDPEEKTDE